MSAYDLSLDEIIRGKRKKPFIKKFGAGRGQRLPMRGRGRAGYNSQTSGRFATLGRGRGGKPSHLMSNDLRLTRLGLSTRKLQTHSQGKSPAQVTGFDLRQKLIARSGQSQANSKSHRPALEERTFKRAITDSVSSHDQLGRVTKPIEVDPEPSVRGIKVTIKGLGRKSMEPIQVDRRERNHREFATGRVSALNPLVRAREVEERRKESRYEEHSRHRPGLQDDSPRALSPYKMRPKQEAPLSVITGTRLVVSNLHPNVSDRDIVELFSAVGELQSACFIDHGVAEVVYYRPDDADVAFKRYHNRNLDGRPMIVKVGVLKPAMYGDSGAFDRTSRRVAAYQRPLPDDGIDFSMRF